MSLLISFFLPRQAIFGHYLDDEGIRKLKTYSYQSYKSTFLDKILNHWWNFVIERCIPPNIAPNLLTLIGFCIVLFASASMLFLNPSLDQPMPPWLYVFLFISILIYQTLDAIDGKQARRTNSMSPLGQLFDHGCDSFTVVLVPLMALSVMRLGCGWSTLAVISVAQIQLFIFCWWDLHFHVFPHSGRLGIGVTEGECFVMLICLTGAIFGADVYTTVITPNDWKQTPDFVQRLFPLSLQTSTFTIASPVLIFAITLLALVSFSDVPFGLQVVKNKCLASVQLFACILHVACQALFYFSPAVQRYPPWGLCLMAAASSSIALRIELSAVSKTSFSPFLWPVYPFDIAGIVFFLLRGSQPPWFDLMVLSLLTFWFAIYLNDLVSTSIDDISKALGVYCFSIEKRKQGSEKLHSRERCSTNGKCKR